MEFNVFFIRIIACFILSILIGLERQCRHRMVGLRTNVLVSLGAFLFVCVSFGVQGNDNTRIAAQVVSGIGFLGAGVILRDGNKIKGLNTAATLWCVSAIGVLTASGMIAEASVGTALVLASNIFLRILSMGIMDRVRKYQKEKCVLHITCNKDIEIVVRTSLAKAIERKNLSLQSLEKNEVTQSEVKLKAVIITSRPSVIEDVVKNIIAESGVSSISWEHDKYYKSDSEDNDANELE